MGKEPTFFLGFIAIIMLPHMTAPQGICLDGQSKDRQPGDEWLRNSTTKCSCSNSLLIVCVKLDKPACTDIRDNFRSDKEMWMNSTCVQCMCLNGRINCSRYVVNVTYGLFNINIFPTCEDCFSPLQTPETSSSCETYLRLSKEKKLYKCTNKGKFIWDEHRCNGISECPDGSDEHGCEDVKCMDEEGGTFLIEDQHGWQVSPCLVCHCKGGLMSCQWNLTVNFPAYLCGFSIYEERCIQPFCNVLQFIRDRKDVCEGVELIKNGGIFMKGQTWNVSGCVFYFNGTNEVKGVTCPPVARPACYVYNGAVCCASECPALKQIAEQMRGHPAICPNGRLIVPSKRQCGKPQSLCLEDPGSSSLGTIITLHLTSPLTFPSSPQATGSTDGSYTTNKPYTTDTPHTRDKPYTTDKPHTTNKPYTTDKPHTRDKPYTTDKPHTTNKPYTTDKPNTTNKPYTTDKPHTRDKLYTTDTLYTTDKPYTTDEQITTDEPDTCFMDGPYATVKPYTAGGWPYTSHRPYMPSVPQSSQSCESDILCQDEEGDTYFGQATWLVGGCIQCSCNSGNIHCSRTIVFLTSKKDNVTETCHQPHCNVHAYLTENKDICKACRWNGKQYFDGDQWKENGVDFFCSSPNQKVRPGCYVQRNRVKCTGAITGLENLSLISKDELFLCESGDEIISLNDRCNMHLDCNDRSDEQNCDHLYCAPKTKFGLLWTRTLVDQAITKNCSLINSSLTGTFSSKCAIDYDSHTTAWLYKNKCRCEKSILVQRFERKIADLNEDNFMSVLDELSRSRDEFLNLPAFYKLLADLFHAGTKLLIPVTAQNSDQARRYCEHVINAVNDAGSFHTVLPFAEHIGTDCWRIYNLHELDSKDELFCQNFDPIEERQSLIQKAEGFLRQFPNITDDQYGATVTPLPFKVICWERSLFERLYQAPVVKISRDQLILQLNIAPLIPSKADTSTSTPPSITSNPTTRTFNSAIITSKDSSASVTTANRSAIVSNSTYTTSNDIDSPTSRKPARTYNYKIGNTTKQQIKEMLEAYNCTWVTFDEESGDVIVTKPDVPADSVHSKIRDNLELVLLCISIAGVIFSLVLLTAIRVKNSERLFVHKNLLLSLGLGKLVFVLDKMLFTRRKEHPALCSTVAVIQHFLYTALFSWMLVEGINLYIMLVKVFSVSRQYLAYAAIGWGIPAVIVGLVAAIKPSTYDMSKTLNEDIVCGSLELTGEVKRTGCWLNGNLWIFKGPVLAALVANLLLFVILLRVIFGKIADKYGKNKVKTTKRGLRSIVALLPLLGVTWLLGFVFKFHVALEYAFIFLNCTQGIVFCIIHCVFDDQVREALRKHRHKQIRVQQPRQSQNTGRANPAIVIERNCAIENLNHLEEGTNTGEVGEKEQAGRYEETKL